jgi:hypothetical protein
MPPPCECEQSQKDNYCGLDCGLLLDQQKEILQHCITHSKYDPVFAPVMVQKLIDQAEQVKKQLLTNR